jgi:hypothetical protein
MALVESMWPVIGPMLEKAVKHSSGCYELEDVLAEIKTGQQQLWVAWDDDAKRVDAAMTTMFDQYPRKKTLKVVFVGGTRMKTWLKEFIELVEQHAKNNGAVMLEGFFRGGWAKVWPGARISGVGLVKELA